jgi:hypothetical protein
LQYKNDDIRTYLIGKCGLRKDYSDIHAGFFNAPYPLSVDAAVKAFFSSIPKVATGMLAIREYVAKQLGLKTAGGREKVLQEVQSFKGNIGDKIALFEVWDRSDKEIVTGQRDKHLDFCLSFHLTKANEEYILKLITLVQINSSLGKAYFFLVKPVHKMLMPIIVKRLCKRLAIQA